MSWWPLCSDSVTDPDKVADKNDLVDFKEVKETGTGWEKTGGQSARLTEDILPREDKVLEEGGGCTSLSPTEGLWLVVSH